MPILTKDFRGIKLCDPCWNGNHWTKAVKGREAVNHCLHGGCECPCPTLPADASWIGKRQRETAKKNREAQQSLLDVPKLYKRVQFP